MPNKFDPIQPLPCPFCGEMPEVEVRRGCDATVMCLDLDCFNPKVTGVTLRKTIERWNTRKGEAKNG